MVDMYVRYLQKNVGIAHVRIKVFIKINRIGIITIKRGLD